MEKILYDTCSLIAKYRKGIRVLEGFTTILNVIEFPKALEVKKLKIIYPSTEDYRLAILLSKDLLKMGKPVPAVDITIAAVALNRNLVLETSDKHFKIIREINRELKLRLVDEYKCSCTDDFS
ncbi:MAG: hypothetical protein J7L38_00800 [Thermoproteales archaeon]|nr:hypothetical protein [Thermoproteales archaeon]